MSGSRTQSTGGLASAASIAEHLEPKHRAGADPVLVERAANGDAAAFEILVTSTCSSLARVAVAILGSEQDARDALQDAYVAAWRQLPRLRDRERFEPWLRRIVVNACRERVRGRRRVREVSLEASPVERHAGGPSVADAVGDQDLLERAFDRLDVDRRAILVMHYLEHTPVATLARVLGIAPGTVKWRLSDARVALTRALTAEGEARR